MESTLETRTTVILGLEVPRTATRWRLFVGVTRSCPISSLDMNSEGTAARVAAKMP